MPKCAVAVVFLFASSAAAGPVVIDTFDVGSGVVTLPSGSAITKSLRQDGLDPDQVLGGSRTLRVVAQPPRQDSLTGILVDADAGVARALLDPSPSLTLASQSAGVNYRVDGGADLTGGGTNDRLRLEILEISADARLRLYLEEPGVDGAEVAARYTNLTPAGDLIPLAPGTLDVPFADLAIDGGPNDSGVFDFGAVTIVSLTVTYGDDGPSPPPPAPVTLTLGSITVVPEPAAASLAALAGGLLLRRGRRRGA